jgi:hypothetical protein
VGLGRHYDVTDLMMKTLPDDVWLFQVFNREGYCTRQECKHAGTMILFEQQLAWI